MLNFVMSGTSLKRGITAAAGRDDLSRMSKLMPQFKVARATALVCVSALAVVLGAATASAATSARVGKPKVTILSTSPSTPVAGKSYTMKLALVKRDGTRLHHKSHDCYARTENRFLPLASKASDGYVATCTWSIPLAARGESMSGILAMVADTDVTYYRGYNNIPIG